MKKLLFFVAVVFGSILLFFPQFTSPVFSVDLPIRVSGFAYVRAMYPMSRDNGDRPFEDTTIIYDLLKNTSNFGPSGIVKCPVIFSPLFPSLVSGSLVDDKGMRKYDVFIGGLNVSLMGQSEALEIMKFIKAGGIFYISANGSTTNNYGLNYNILFETLGLEDRFSEVQEDFVIQNGTTDNPLDIYPTTNGLFGTVGPMTHSPYRVFSVVSMNIVAKGYGDRNTIISETPYGSGYLINTGNPMYINPFVVDRDNQTYFLNLFAMGCNRPNPTPAPIPTPTEPPLPTLTPTSKPTDTPTPTQIPLPSPTPTPDISPTPISTNTPIPVAQKILEVPSFKQGLTPWTDNKPVWESYIYDHSNKQVLACGKSIAQCGCALTSVTMILANYGVTRGPSLIPLNPGSLNDYFNLGTNKIESYFKSYGYSNGGIIWNSVSRFSENAHATDISQGKVSNVISDDFSISKVKDYIDKDRPVILKVSAPRKDGARSDHWVVVKGYIGDKLVINDPSLLDPTLGDIKTLEDFDYRPYVNSSLRIYNPTHSDFSSLELITNSPETILVTDNLGRRVGFDAITNQSIQEIPDAYSFYEEQIGDDTDINPPPPIGSGRFYIIINYPLKGSYKVVVEDKTDNKHSFVVYTSDHSAKVESYAISGTNSKTGSTNYVFDYNPETLKGNLHTNVSIDITPYIYPNYLIPKSLIPISVAILSSSEFDAVKDINQSTLTFGHVGNENSLLFCLRDGIDVNKDKRKDLLCFFWMKSAGILKGDTQAILRGMTVHGIPFEASDKIRTSFK